MHLHDRGACGFYRASSPAAWCAPELGPDIELTCSDSLEHEDYDAFIFHRVLHPHFMSVVERLKSKGKKVAIELDDDHWNIPKWNPASRTIRQAELDTLEWSLNLADQIWVSTPELGKIIDRSEKLKVLPNLVDDQHFNLSRANRPERVRILWAGSVHHDGDIAPLVPVVEQLCAKYGDGIEVVFMGSIPEALSSWQRVHFTNLARAVARPDLPQLRFIEPVDLSDYHGVLSRLRPDIGLCPLADNQFNRSKSGIKFLEYTLGGAAVVATDLPPYQLIRNNQDGLLLPPDATPDQWVAAIGSLVEDRVKRFRFRERARQQVIRRNSWTVRGKVWVDAFRGLVV